MVSRVILKNKPTKKNLTCTAESPFVLGRKEPGMGREAWITSSSTKWKSNVSAILELRSASHALGFREERCEWFWKDLHRLHVRCGGWDKVKPGQFYARSTVCKEEMVTAFGLVAGNSPEGHARVGCRGPLCGRLVATWVLTRSSSVHPGMWAVLSAGPQLLII